MEEQSQTVSQVFEESIQGLPSVEVDPAEEPKLLITIQSEAIIRPEPEEAQ